MNDLKPEDVRKDIGIIVTFYGTVPPYGWLLCDGSRIPKSAYLNLYRVLNTGGFAVNLDNSDNFVVPNIANSIIKAG